MALHDFQCPQCGVWVEDVNVPIAIGAARWHVQCEPCTVDLNAPVLCEWVPQVGRMDAKEPFQRFTTTDGHGKDVEVGSLHQLRKIERESEQLARNKEGQQIAFRAWSQDQSNTDANTFGSTTKRTPFKTRNSRGVPFVSAVKQAPSDA